jgi:uncharacterized membrane protein YgcG
MVKPKIKKSSHVSRRRYYNALSAIIIVLAISVVGGYYILKANANYNPDYISRKWIPGDVYLDWGPNSTPEQVGQNVSRDVSAYVPEATSLRDVNDGMHLSLWMHTYKTATYVNPPGYTCKSGLHCVASSREVARSWSVEPIQLDFISCIDVPSTKYGSKGLGILSVPYKINLPQPQHAVPQVQIGWEWSAGTCYAPKGYSITVGNSDWISGSISTVAGGSVLGDDRSSGEAPGNNPGTGGTSGGDGTGTDGRSGGSGSSSRATSISSTPNAVPSTTAQGTDQEQSKLEPSPFYDGKEYTPGSDSSLEDAGVAASVFRQTTKQWPYTVAVLLLLAIGGYVAWHFKLGRHGGVLKRK